MARLYKDVSSSLHKRLSPDGGLLVVVEESADSGRFITTGGLSYKEDVWGTLEEGIMEAYHSTRPMED